MLVQSAGQTKWHTRGAHQAPGLISIRGARAAYFGPALDLTPHRNAVGVIALAMDGSFEVAFLEEPKPVYEMRNAVLVPPGCLHHLKASGPMAFIYLDALGDDLAAVQQSDLAAAGQVLSKERLENWNVDRACAVLNLPKWSPCDPRIAPSLRAMDCAPDAFIKFTDVANRSGLSPSRCRALIRKATGVSFRRYRIWRRMAFVARHLAGGSTLTEAAFASGFASSAHLSFAFRKMFGIKPSALLRAGIGFDLD